jgi:hypothetical protein
MVETINIFSCNSHMMLEVKIHLYERDMFYLSIAFFKWSVASIPPIIEDHVKNQSTPAVNHSGDVEWLDTMLLIG